jgi:hypothetical protein
LKNRIIQTANNRQMPVSITVIYVNFHYEYYDEIIYFKIKLIVDKHHIFTIESAQSERHFHSV